MLLPKIIKNKIILIVIKEIIFILALKDFVKKFIYLYQVIIIIHQVIKLIVYHIIHIIIFSNSN